MALFRSQTHQDIWIDHHCGRCYWGSQNCQILARALRTGRKPVEWDRNNRDGALMAETLKCNSETRTPPKYGGTRTVTDETMAMFDVEPPPGSMDTDHQ